jgi:hypothetical protein
MKVLGLLAALLAPLGCRGVPAPSIIHVVMDDIGWNDLGFVNKHILTPRIDDLAVTGLVLTHFYTAKECAPTRGALMVPRMSCMWRLPAVVDSTRGC